MCNQIEHIKIFTDGGSRGNPGPAAAGFVLTGTQGNQLLAKGVFLGEATNNVAEYTGMIKALESAKELGVEKVSVFSDSELLVKQINGRYKVKSEKLKPLFRQTINLLNRFEDWQVRHITRDKNKQADKLVNHALDLKRDVETEPMPMDVNEKPVRLGVLISGGGTTLMNILEYIDKGLLNAKVAVVISSRSTVSGVEKAKNAGLNTKIIRRKNWPDIDEFSKQIENELVKANVDLVVQGGWLCLWKIPKRYTNRVMNIHPALLPSFGGQGMWGHYVHEAVIEKGCKISGCTVHFCTNEYDEGPIIVQRSCPVKENDTPEALAARVFEQECIAYPQAIKLFAQGRLKIEKAKVRINR